MAFSLPSGKYTSNHHTNTKITIGNHFVFHKIDLSITNFHAPFDSGKPNKYKSEKPWVNLVRHLDKEPKSVDNLHKTLEMMQNSALFQGSDRLIKLLRFTLEHQIKSPDAPLKAYSIATQVFGRRADFDPSSDAIVRVEMARLRTALQLFYASNPRAPTYIEIPKGSYKPLIRAIRPAVPELPDHTPSQLRATSLWNNLHYRLLVVFLVCLLSVGLALEVIFHRLPLQQARQELRPPIITINPITVSGSGYNSHSLSQVLTVELAGQLSIYPWHIVTLVTDDSRSRTQPQQDGRRQYGVRLNVTRERDQISILALLSDAENGEVIWQSRKTQKISEEQELLQLTQIVRQAAGEIGNAYGAIVTAETQGNRLTVAEGEYACYLKMIRYFTDYRPDNRDRFFACALTENRAGESPRPLALAIRSVAQMIKARWYPGPERERLLRAANADAEAADLISNGAYLVDSVLMRSRGCIGDLQGASAVAEKIAQQRPNHAIALTEVSFFLIFRLGKTDLGLDVLQQMTRLVDPSTHSLPKIIPALVSLQKGAVVEARRKLGDASKSLFPPNLVFGLALSDPTQDRHLVENLMLRLKEAGFDSNERILSIVDNECWADDIKALIRPLVMKALTRM